MVLAVLVVANPAAVSAASWAATSRPPVESVLAQGLVELDGGGYTWRWVTHEVTVTASSLPANEAGFLIAVGDAAVVLTDPFGGALLLTDGEAVHRSQDQAVTWTAIALAESSGRSATGALGELTLAPSPTGNDAFRPGAGWHDLELSRRVLDAGESFEVPGHAPVFVIDGGAALVDGAGTTMDVDASVVLSGQTLVNASPTAVAVVVATVGPVIDLDGAATITPTVTDGATTPAPPTQAATTTPPTTTATATTTAQSPATTLAATTTTRSPTTTTSVTTTTQHSTTTVGGITPRTTTIVGGITTATTVPR